MKKHYLNPAPQPKASGRSYAFTPTRLATLIAAQFVLGISLQPAAVWAEDYFNPHALEIDTPGQQSVDLERFSSQGGQLPGTYRVDIF